MAVQMKNIVKRADKAVPNEGLEIAIVDLGAPFRVMRFSS